MAAGIRMASGFRTARCGQRVQVGAAEWSPRARPAAHASVRRRARWECSWGGDNLRSVTDVSGLDPPTKSGCAARKGKEIPASRSVAWVSASARSHADVLLHTRTRAVSEVFIYVLLEHQSTQDRLMPLRFFQYTERLWSRWLREHPNAARLPAVLPVIVYHGREPWTAPVRLTELLDLAPAAVAGLQPHVPELAIVLDDLSQRTQPA